MSRVFLARCHHGVSSEIFNRLFPNIKLDWHLAPTGIVFLFSLLMMSGTHTQNKILTKSQRKETVDNFCRGGQYERLGRKESRQFSETKIDFEKLPAGGGARG